MGHDAKINPFSREAKLAPVVRDARNRVLQEGDEVLLDMQGPVYFRVVAITPVLDPNAPPNMMQIEVAADIHWHAVRESRNKEFIRVRTAEEAGPSPFRRIVEPEPETPTGDPT